MVEINQFGSAQPGSPQVCGRCESLLMDMLDGTASTEDQSFFDRHVASCTGCSQMLTDARRGGAWLEMLRDPRPEPPAVLFERILAQTTGLIAPNSMASVVTPSTTQEEISRAHSASAGVFGAAGTPAAYQFNAQNEFRSASHLKVVPFRIRAAIHGAGQAMLQPRLAMTAAMAFFSIALTLNLTGVHVSELRASDLRPANIRRGFHEANAHVVRYCDNLRVVYELEARAHDLQRNAESDAPSTTPDDAPKKDSDPNHSNSQPNTPKATPKPGPGTSRREPLTHDDRLVATLSLHRSSASQLKNVPVTYPKGDQA